LVQLRGKKSALGIDAFLGLGDDADRLQALLCEFDRDQSSATDPLLQRLEQRLERGRRMLSVAPLVAQVDMPTGGAEYKLQLVCRGEMDVDALCDLEARAWPITLSEISAKGLRPGDAALAEWPHVSCEGLTPFFAFELVARSGSSEEKQRFVLKLPLLGAPFDRGERLVRDLFANQRDLERFFLMLLADEDNPQDIFSVPADSRDQGRSRGTQYPQGVPLFEAMVRALENRPERLDEIAVWVEEFQKTPEGRRLLPSGFEELWRPLWAARQEVRQ